MPDENIEYKKTIMIIKILSIGQAESARILNCSQSYISRLVNRKQGCSFEQADKIIEKLEVYL